MTLRDTTEKTRTACSKLLDDHRFGVDGKTIQAILRHSSVQSVKRDAVAAMKRLEVATQPGKMN